MEGDEFGQDDDEPLYDVSLYENFIEPAESPCYDAFHTVDAVRGEDNGVSPIRVDQQTVENGNSYCETTNIYVGNENGSDDITCKTRCQKREPAQKLKKNAVDAKTTAPKRKRSKEMQNVLAPKPPKKFPHRTRRRKRKVDKVLLQTPEEELDRPNLPFKDLILLAEYQERLSSKEAAARRSANNDITGNGSYNENGFDPEQDQGSLDARGNIDIRHDGSYFNYQTYMDKTSVIRWTKCETELFYEAVKQFGSDISMIQQLFPHRTRRQVKLKYKKEERQHPLRLDDALHSRSKDHSRFEQVIEILRKAASSQEAATPMDGSVHEECEEMETHVDQTHGDAEAHLKSEETATAAASIPAESHDSDEDILRWSQYTSDI